MIIEIYSLFSLALNFSYSDFGSKVSVNVIGPFVENTINTSNDYVSISIRNGNFKYSSKSKRFEIDEKNWEFLPLSFDVNPESTEKTLNFSLMLKSNRKSPIAFQLFVDPHSVDSEIGILSAGIILIFLNILIATEVIHSYLIEFNCSVKEESKKIS